MNIKPIGRRILLKITKEEIPSERWHLYTIKVSKNDIENLSKNIKPKWMSIR